MAIINFIISSIIAGLAIGFAGSAYLVIPNTWVGALAFSIGMYLVILYGFKLFTGFIPQITSIWVIDKRRSIFVDIIDLILCLIGNVTGCYIAARILQVTPKYQQVIHKAQIMLSYKYDWRLALFGGIACGCIIAFITLLSDKTYKLIFTLPLIALFIVCGFEHCIADAFYMFFANDVHVGFLALTVCGNVIGGSFIGLFNGLNIKMLKGK